MFEWWKYNTIWLPRRRKKNNKIHLFSICFANEFIFFNMNDYQNLSKDRKNISVHAGSAPPSCFGTGHVTVLSTPSRKTEYALVLQQRFQCTWFLFCLFRVKGIKRTAKSILPLESWFVPWRLTLNVPITTVANNNFYDISGLVKSAYRKCNFLIYQPKHMFWVFKRTVSMRRFFWAPKTYVKTDG